MARFVMTLSDMTKKPDLQSIQKLLAALQAELSRRQGDGPTATVKTALAATPGASRSDLVSSTKLDPRVVSNALAGLQERGEALHVGDRRGARWYLVSSLDALTRPSEK